MAKPLFEREELERIEAKIAAAEGLTTAEIRVAITRSSWLGIERKARRLFSKYSLDQTAARNGVLLLIDVRSRELAIVGDEAVDSRVGGEFWQEVRDAIIEELRHRDLAAGIGVGVRLLGEKLAELFPTNGVNENEISNLLIFD